MSKFCYEIESELLEMEAQRQQIDKALCGRMSLPEEEVIRIQAKKAKDNWTKWRKSNE